MVGGDIYSRLFYTNKGLNHVECVCKHVAFNPSNRSNSEFLDFMRTENMNVRYSESDSCELLESGGPKDHLCVQFILHCIIEWCRKMS